MSPEQLGRGRQDPLVRASTLAPIASVSVMLLRVPIGLLKQQARATVANRQVHRSVYLTERGGGDEDRWKHCVRDRGQPRTRTGAGHRAASPAARRVYAGARQPESVDIPGAIPVAIDITDPASVAAAAASAGDVNLLINNAGISTGTSLLDRRLRRRPARARDQLPRPADGHPRPSRPRSRATAAARS